MVQMSIKMMVMKDTREICTIVHFNFFISDAKFLTSRRNDVASTNKLWAFYTLCNVWFHLWRWSGRRCEMMLLQVGVAGGVINYCWSLPTLFLCSYCSLISKSLAQSLIAKYFHSNFNHFNLLTTLCEKLLITKKTAMKRSMTQILRLIFCC